MEEEGDGDRNRSHGHEKLLVEDSMDEDELNRRISRWDCLLKAWRHDPLLFYTVCGVVCGIVLGIILTSSLPPGTGKDSPRYIVTKLVGFPGRAFLNLLKMMVLPLISGSMIAGVCALKEAGSSTKRLAKIAISFMAGTTFLAVIVGLVVVVTIQPGSAVSSWTNSTASSKSGTSAGMLETILDVFLKMCPPNIVEAAANMNILGVLVFSVFFGVMLSRLDSSETATMIHLITIFNHVVMKMVEAILWLSPLGICCLISSQMCESDDLGNKFRSLVMYIIAVTLALAFHGLVLLPAIFWFNTKTNPWTFTKGLLPALATAFGTDSSSATLPVTILCCERNGVSPQICKFVLPLGATVNMNGTALYEALTVIFIAQLHQVPLSAGHMIVIAATSTLAAVGAAAIPSAGLVTMVMVLQAAGLDEYTGDLSLIFTVDWALDRMRTTVNVLGDAYCAGVTQHMTSSETEESV
uniref:Amino acid transporter n=1 Tax=Hanusia phi TaxID=3032 RepID=A0A6T7MIG4_9CRYP